MTHNEVKEKIKNWVTDIGIGKKSTKQCVLTIEDLLMFAFDSAVSVKEVKKGVSALAKEGFLKYGKVKVKRFLQMDQSTLCFKKCN